MYYSGVFHSFSVVNDYKITHIFLKVYAYTRFGNYTFWSYMYVDILIILGMIVNHNVNRYCVRAHLKLKFSSIRDKKHPCMQCEKCFFHQH